MKGNKFKIVIKSLINSDTAVSTDDGDLIYQRINDLLSKNQIVEIDFEGISIMTTAFLNAAIGQLYSNYVSEKLNDNLQLINVADDDKILFKKVITRAKEYFSDRDDFSDSADNVIYGS